MCTNIAKCQVIHLEKKGHTENFVYIGQHDQKHGYSRKETACEHRNYMSVARKTLRIAIFLTEAYNFGHRTDKKLVNYSLLDLGKK